MRVKTILTLVILGIGLAIVPVNGQQVEKNETTKESSTRLAALRQRVETFWRLNQNSQLDRSYDMLTKESRQNYSLVKYIRQNNMGFTRFDIASITVAPDNPDRARVLIYFDGNAMGYSMKKIRTHQTWIFENGDWYVRFKKTNPFVSQTENVDGSSRKKRTIDPETLRKLRALAEKLRHDKSQVPANAEAARQKYEQDMQGLKGGEQTSGTTNASGASVGSTTKKSETGQSVKKNASNASGNAKSDNTTKTTKHDNKKNKAKTDKTDEEKK